MTPTEAYDAIIIGAGQSGGPLSTALGKAGKRTVIVEREHVGGTCINEGCTPTKTMVASARVAYLARRASDYGVNAGPVSIDLPIVRQRKRDIVTSWRDGSQNHIEQSDNVTLLMGEAGFSGPRQIDVRLRDGTTRRLTSDLIIINSGERPSLPDLPGLRQVPTLNSTSIMELGEIPDHLVILGGGYIALEFGQMFRRFGSRVTIIQRSGQLLSREDIDVAEEVARILREDGVEILFETAVQQVAQSGDGRIALTLHTPDGERVVSGSHLLVATGRTPNVEALNLDVPGVQRDDRGYIHVNERLETNVPGIYAMGDVKGGPAFTHISYDDFRVMRANLVEGKTATIAHRLVPYTVFIDPQLGRVGMGEQEARHQGYNIRVAKLPMSSVARAIETDETRGFMKAVVDVQTQQILGCAILGIDGGEIAAVIEVAMMGKLPYTALKEGVFAHPTLAESLNNLFMTLDD
ncbi:MAG TPA: mercuric reductase [Ktedonobacterales bacterium]|nr:mercuric reductase [Ktedonobacterales bacterium]